MMNITVDGLECALFPSKGDNVAYILSPMGGYERLLSDLSVKYGISIAVISGMDWDDDLTPWPADGVPDGSEPFKGDAPQFLSRLVENVLPHIEVSLKCKTTPRRSLVGISLSGLFALWQWIGCDVFTDIASISGSFWYDGFVDWLASRNMPRKNGMAYFSLGDKERLSAVSKFASVADDTAKVISILGSHGIDTRFRSVPGNHYQFLPERLELAFAALYGTD